MVRREIQIDEDADRILTQPASECQGLEGFANRSEEARERALRTLQDRSEADFREGRTLSWNDVKARNGL